MKFLTSEIECINDRISENISGISKFYGLARQMLVSGDNINIEIKTRDRVYIDTDQDNFYYHKLKATSFTEIKAPGKKKLYNAIVSVELVCFSRNQSFDSHILNALSNYNLVSIKGINYDSSSIAKSEFNITDFDFEQYLFVVSYEIPIKTDNCIELCQ